MTGVPQAVYGLEVRGRRYLGLRWSEVWQLLDRAYGMVPERFSDEPLEWAITGPGWQQGSNLPASHWPDVAPDARAFALYLQEVRAFLRACA